jgi:hypothetical protein
MQELFLQNQQFTFTEDFTDLRGQWQWDGLFLLVAEVMEVNILNFDLYKGLSINFS